MTDQEPPNYTKLCFEMLREMEYLTTALRRYGMVAEADRAGNFTRKVRKTLLSTVFEVPVK